MRIFESITSKYKKIAAGIAIVSFLAIMYLAMIPGIVPQIVASAGVYDIQSVGICGATVKIVQWSNIWNTTTSCDVPTLGNYSLTGVSYDGNDPNGTTYTVRAIKEGYGPDSKKVTLNSTNPDAAVSFDLVESEPIYIPYSNDGAIYSSQIQVFNPYDINITVDDRVIRNGANKSYDYEIAPKNIILTSSKQIYGANFLGSVKVESTQPLKVQGIFKTLSNGIYSIAPSRNVSAETIQYIPYLYDVNPSYDTGIQIFNLDPVNSIQVNITAIRNGVEKSINYSLAKQTLSTRTAELVWGGNFAGGTIKVNTSGPALIQGNIRTVATDTASITPAVVGTPVLMSQYIPYSYDSGSYASGIQIFNPDPVNSIQVNITAIRNGVEKSINYSLAKQTLSTRYADVVWGGNFPGGTIRVNTSGPALVQGNIISSGTTSIAPSTIISEVNIQYLPYLIDVGSSYDSSIQIFNPNAEQIIANITAYNKLNGQTYYYDLPINPGVLASRYAQVVAGGNDFEGAVKVETKAGNEPRPALVQGAIIEKLTGTFSIATAVK